MSYKVFISYAHKDRSLLNELETHLSLLQRQKLISTWYDGNISPGTEWRKHIMDHMESAQIFLLLVSADFMHSEFCYSIEMDFALQRHKADQARVIPIMLRPVYWKGAPFAALKILPTDAKPVTSWSKRDAAYLNVVEGIADAIKELQQKGKAPNP